MKVHLRGGFVCATSLVLVGCPFSGITEFPDGLEPLDELVVSAPEAEPDEPYPEAFNVLTGEDEAYFWGQGFGYVHASVAEVWGALQNPDVNVDRRRIDLWTTDWDIETPFDQAYQIEQTANEVVTVSWIVEWRHGALVGGISNPKAVAGRWQKVDGTAFLSVLEGSFVLLEVESDVTELQIIEHLQALQTSEQDIENFFIDLFAEVVSLAHGEGLPDLDDLPSALSEE